MSVSYKSHALIGLRIDKHKISTMEKQRACRCKAKVSKSTTYCSNCGVLAWNQVEVPKEFIGGDYPETLENCWFQGKSVKYEIVQSFNHDRPSTFFIVLAHVDAYDGSKRSRIDFSNIMDQISQMKEDLGGLWSVKDFGLWSALAVS